MQHKGDTGLNQPLLILLCLGLLLNFEFCTANPAAHSHFVSAGQAPTNGYGTSGSSSSSSSDLAPLGVKQSAIPCGHIPGEPDGQVVTSCLQWQQRISCAFLEAQGYIAGTAQGIEPAGVTGNFSAPGTCGATALSLALRGQQQLAINAGERSVLAVIGKGPNSQVYFLGRGVSKGLIGLRELPVGLELCLAPAGEGGLQVQQITSYSQHLAPGSVNWQLKHSVQLPPAFQDGTVNLIQGDSVEATWTLAATKSGEEASYQGVVSGTISLTNSRPVPVTVYGVLTAVRGGPSATINCGPSMPFEVPPCTTMLCSFTATYPQPPLPGRHQATTTVQYQELKRGGVAVVEAETAFQVTSTLPAAVAGGAKVPAGQALVTNNQLPGQIFTFTGTGQQAYTTTLKCPSSSVANSATLLASTGQQVAATAAVQKNCHELDVRLAEVGEPVVARWHWTVQQTASLSQLSLRSASSLLVDSSQQPLWGPSSANGTAVQQLFGGRPDAAGDRPTTADVTYTVHVVRSLSKGADGKVMPFMLRGKVTITNPAPMNAKLAGVSVMVSDPSDKASSVTVAASCPILVVGSGQRLTCSWTSHPTFNPVGGVVSAVVRYAATLNGEAPSGAFTDFKSAPIIVGEGIGGIGLQGQGAPATFAGPTRGLSAWGVAKSFHRALLQWAGSGVAGTPTFNPAGFLSRVWGHTGATTVVSSAVPANTFSSAAAVANGPSQQHLYSSTHPATGQHGGFAAPTPVSSLNIAQSWSTARPGADAYGNVQYGSGMVVYGVPEDVQYSADRSEGQLQQASAADDTASTPAPASQQGSSSSRSSITTLPIGQPHRADPHMRIAGPGDASSSLEEPWSVVDASARLAAPSHQPSVDDPVGLLDDCATISHELGSGPGVLPGRLVSGKPPAGRVCHSSVFVYRVRYGPYEACNAGTRATTAAKLLTGDTRRMHSSMTDVGVDVQGCQAGLVASVAAARPVADVKATWHVQMRTEHAHLQLQPGQIVDNSYSVSYSRDVEGSAARLDVVLSLRNTGSTVVLLAEAAYTVNMTCGGQQHIKTNAFMCQTNRVAGGDSRNCSFVVPLPCTSGGLLQAQLKLSTGEVVRTPVAAFDAPDLEKLAAAHSSGCVKVQYDGFGTQADSMPPGKLASGQLLEARLCSPRTFTVTHQFGPYSTCGHWRVPSSASFETNEGASRSETLQTTVEVHGCDGVGTKEQAAAAVAASRHSHMRLARTAASHKVSRKGGAAAALPRGSCVHQPWFWKQCMLQSVPSDADCGVIQSSLPGGQGPRTPFFPYRKAPMVKRTYRQLMVMPRKTGNKVVDLHFQTAKVFIAAQLNRFSGVAMPAPVKQAYVFLGKDYFSVYDDRSAAKELAAKPQVLQQVASAAAVLADFTGGKYPGLPTCAALLKQQKRHPT